MNDKNLQLSVVNVVFIQLTIGLIKPNKSTPAVANQLW